MYRLLVKPKTLEIISVRSCGNDVTHNFFRTQYLLFQKKDVSRGNFSFILSSGSSYLHFAMSRAQVTGIFIVQRALTALKQRNSMLGFAAVVSTEHGAQQLISRMLEKFGLIVLRATKTAVGRKKWYCI